MNSCQPLAMQRRQKLFIYFLQVGPTLYTYLHSHVKFRYVLVAATPVIREDNTTDQKTASKWYLSYHAHIAMFRDHLQHTLADVTDKQLCVERGREI
jgi:hypothetical protein